MAQLAEPIATSARPAWLTSETIGFVVMVAILVVAPAFIYPLSLMKMLCFALFACAFNLLIGYVGLLSFGHALYFGWAAYIAAHLAKVGTISLPYWRAAGQWLYFVIPLPPLSPELAILGGTLAAGVLGLADDRHLYYVVAVIFFAGLLVIYRIIHSPFGQVLKAIRDNEPRAISLGYRANQYKLTVFVLSATLAGLGGATKAIVFQLASLTDVHWTMSGEVVLMTLVGGMGTVFGPIVGALVIVAMQNYLAHLGAWVTVVQGTIFVICVLLFREGIVGVIGRWLKRPL